MTPAEEHQIIRKACKQPRHFAPLFRTYHPRVYRFIWKRVKDDDLAADLASQTFVKVLDNLHRYRPTAPFGAWLFRIATNVVHQHFREMSRIHEVPLSAEIAAQLWDELAESTGKEAQLQRLVEALNQLDALQVNLIELRYFEGRPFAEMGAILGITTDNAKVKTYRALAALKAIIFTGHAEV